MVSTVLLAYKKTTTRLKRLKIQELNYRRCDSTAKELKKNKMGSIIAKVVIKRGNRKKRQVSPD